MTESSAAGATGTAGPAKGLSPFMLDTSALPLAERVEQWRTQMAPIGTVEIEPSPPGLWNVRTHAWNLAGMLVSAGEYGAQRMVRTPALVRKEPIDHYTLHLAHDGTGLRMQHHDRELIVSPGQPLLSDLAQPKALWYGEAHITSLFIPRDALDRLLPRQFDLHGVVPQGAGGALLVAHLQSLVRRLPGMTRCEVAGAFEATLHLLAASLAPSAAMLDLASPALTQTLMHQVLRHIDDNLLRADLSSEGVCAAFGLSRATLYRMFEPLGGVVHYIRSQRLERIHSVLLAPSGRVYMSRLAEEHGFKNAAHFSRAFRAHFGYAPTEIQGARAAIVIDPGRTTPARWWRTVLTSPVMRHPTQIWDGQRTPRHGRFLEFPHKGAQAEQDSARTP
jgi:AraC-like DNA-binding protein